jgi:hypothetical protein
MKFKSFLAIFCKIQLISKGFPKIWAGEAAAASSLASSRRWQSASGARTVDAVGAADASPTDWWVQSFTFPGLHNYEKSQFLMAKSTSNCNFQWLC